MDQALRDLGDYIDAGNAGAVLGTEVAYGELMVTAEAAAVPKLLRSCATTRTVSSNSWSM